MVDALTEPFAHTIGQRALLEVVLIGAVAGPLGVWVVLHRQSYAAESLAHAMLPGLVAAAPVIDTIKRCRGEGLEVVETPDRSELWAIQTPQAFRADALRAALDVPPERLAAATDDASLVEAAGGRVRVYPVADPNPKLTRPVDRFLIEALLREREPLAR